MRPALLFFLTAILAHAEEPIDASQFLVTGRANFKGKEMELKGAYAQWRPKQNEIFLMLYPYMVGTGDLDAIEKDKDFTGIQMPSPDPSTWSWAPMIWITVTFEKGTGPFTPESMKQATIAFCDFGEKGASSTISGDGFLFHQDFQSFSLKSPAIGEVAEFSISSKDPTTHHYEIEVQGVARILSNFDY